MSAIDEDRIRERAYELSEAAGHPEGNDEHFWHAARLELIGKQQAADLAAEMPEMVEPPTSGTRRVP